MVDSSDGSHLYVVSGGVLFRSSDGGETASPVANDEFGGLVQATTVASGVVFAGSRTGVYRSEDAGTSWGVANRGISEISVGSLAVDPADPSVVFAASPQGIHEIPFDSER